MAKITKEMMQAILQNVGGSENIRHAGNCMTRLRLTLNNDQLVDKTAIKQIPGVLGVIESEDQLQIVLGPGKAQTASDLMNQLLESDESGFFSNIDTSLENNLNALASSNKQQMKQKQTSAIHRFLSKFATIFTPLIPGFIAAGLLLGFATLATQTLYPGGLPKSPEQQTFAVHLILYMSVFSKGLFSF